LFAGKAKAASRGIPLAAAFQILSSDLRIGIAIGIAIGIGGETGAQPTLDIQETRSVFAVWCNVSPWQGN
jgi:hypothetical protein